MVMSPLKGLLIADPISDAATPLCKPKNPSSLQGLPPSCLFAPDSLTRTSLCAFLL